MAVNPECVEPTFCFLVETSLVANPPSHPKTHTINRARNAMHRFTPVRLLDTRASFHAM
jgi:hypothetical protein